MMNVNSYLERTGSCEGHICRAYPEFYDSTAKNFFTSAK